ncbi:MAG: heme o synthase [Rickettsiales bacterium]
MAAGSVSYSYKASGTVTSTIKDYVTLMKPGVMLLVVFTGTVGMIMAPGHLPPLMTLLTVLCIALGSGAGGAINMWYDKDIDSIMKRTSARPVPSERVSADDALAFGIVLAIASVSLLGLAVSWAAAWLLAFSIWFYAGVYTILLKRSTPQNIVIGGAAGAFPPVIGWLAVTPHLTLEPFLYFLIIFFWTPPHFWALALYRSDDYRKSGVPMLPVTAGIESTKKHIVLYSLILAAAALLPGIIAQPGWLYVAASVLLSGIFMRYVWRVYVSHEPKDAYRLFGYSISYLFLLFFMLVLDKLLTPIIF